MEPEAPAGRTASRVVHRRLQPSVVSPAAGTQPSTHQGKDLLSPALCVPAALSSSWHQLSKQVVSPSHGVTSPTQCHVPQDVTSPLYHFPCGVLGATLPCSCSY